MRCSFVELRTRTDYEIKRLKEEVSSILVCTYFDLHLYMYMFCFA